MNSIGVKICALACGLLALSGCTGRTASNGKPVLAVSIEPQRAILEQLAGDNFEIVTVLPAGANPETFDPTLTQRMSMADAEAYFTIGYLPFENVLAAESKRVVEVSKGIEPVMGTHSHGDHVHVEADPHVWTSLRNGKIIAVQMARTLKELDPDNAGIYDERLYALEHELDSLDAAVGQQLARAGVKSFAVWHPSLSYFARDYGLRQISVGQESKEASPAALKSVINEALADSVRVFFYQKAYDSRQAQSLNAEIGSRLVEINPLAGNWENEILKIADEISK